MLVPINSPRSSQANDDLHLINLWLRGKSQHSQEAYTRDVEQFVDFVDLPLSEIKMQHFWDWADHLKKQGALPATQARKLAAVKSLFSFGHKIGYLQFNVGAAITLPSIPDKLAERILLEEDIIAIVSQARTLRNRVLLKLFYASGARVSELASVYWGALIPRGDQQGQISLLGKGNKMRTLLLPASVWKELMELKSKSELNEPNQPVFRSRKGGPLSRQQIWRIVRDAARAAGFDKNVSPHWLRHAHASHALDHGAPVHLVQESLGHRSLTTTSKYTHARPNDSSSKYLNI
ncbi:MAG: tyrosine-type recombinase/integrase [Bacteroidetes bacterium]|nr:tyrosine-type recombinase/integrase [Bacteroidota bacterium]